MLDREKSSEKKQYLVRETSSRSEFLCPGMAVCDMTRDATVIVDRL